MVCLQILSWPPIAGLATVPPLTTFSQNSGVIALTRNASRSSGYMCASILFLMGIIGRFGAIFCAAPSSVIGGFTTFLFGAVTTSGVRVLAYCKWTRRDRFIATVSIALGMSSLCVPQWFSYFFTYIGSNCWSLFFSFFLAHWIFADFITLSR